MVSREIIIAIIGSRKFKDYQFLEDNCLNMMVVLALQEKQEGRDDPSFRIISGEADGADTLGKLFTQQNGFSFQGYPPRFKKEGTPYRRRDYYDRDVKMAEDTDVVFAFLVKDPKENRGSKLTIKAAIDRWKPTYVFFK